MEYIFSEKGPKPAGHYSPALIHNGIIYVSGQLPVVPGSTSREIGTIEEQFEQVLDNLSSILESAGSDLEHVLRTTVYISDIDLWDKVNAVYTKRFGDHKPARTIVPTRDLHYGYHVEIDAIAAVKE